MTRWHSHRRRHSTHSWRRWSHHPRRRSSCSHWWRLSDHMWRWHTSMRRHAWRRAHVTWRRALRRTLRRWSLLLLLGLHSAFYRHNLINLWLLTFMLLLELDKELRVIFDFIIDMFLSPAMLFSAKRRRMLQVDSAVLAIKVRHYYLYYNSNNN